MATKKLRLAGLAESDYNPRRITPEEMGRLKTLIKEHSAAVEGREAGSLRLATTITVNRQGLRIVGGHQRVRALGELGQDWIDARDVTWVDLVPGSAKEKALNVALNSQDAAGDWDYEALASVLGDIDTSEIDLGWTGLAEGMLSQLMEDPEPPEVEFPEFDESAGDEVVFHECPKCNHRWPA